MPSEPLTDDALTDDAAMALALAEARAALEKKTSKQDRLGTGRSRQR